MPAVKRSISFPSELQDRMTARMAELDLHSLSDYFQHLIREDVKKHAALRETHGPAITPPIPPVPPAKPSAPYKIKRPSRK